MTTYPLPTLAPTISAAGITAPSYADILLSLQASYTAIYGSDIDLDPSEQDGQWLAIQAAAINDSNQAIIADYLQRSPSTATGAGLSSAVKINGIRRAVSSNSTAAITYVGQAGAQLVNPLVGDNQGLGTSWLFSGTITIPGGGSITQTATCTQAGSVHAAANTLNSIQNPTFGWQTANNALAAVPGNPVETDPALRSRQASSTSLGALTIVQTMIGQIENLPGVAAAVSFENDTGTTNALGIPAYSLAMVVQGGALQSIVNVIGQKKAPGPPTYGNTSGTYADPAGVPHTINFSIPVQQTISVTGTITALAGYSTSVLTEIQNAVTTYINSLGIGQNVLISRLYAPILLQGSSASPANPNDPFTYDLNVGTVKAAVAPGTPGTVDLVIGFNSIAVPGTVSITVI